MSTPMFQIDPPPPPKTAEDMVRETQYDLARAFEAFHRGRVHDCPLWSCLCDVERDLQKVLELVKKGPPGGKSLTTGEK